VNVKARTFASGAAFNAFGPRTQWSWRGQDTRVAKAAERVFVEPSQYKIASAFGSPRE
jgi:hypothetical protein